MATPQERQQDFVDRLKELAIDPYVSISNQNKIPERINIKVSDKNPLRPESINYMVMGLIAHFINRKWAKDWNYTYIMKSHHSITFTNQSD